MKKFYNMEFGTYKEQGDSVILEINKNRFNSHALFDIQEVAEADERFFQVSVSENEQSFIFDFSIEKDFQNLKTIVNRNLPIKLSIAKTIIKQDILKTSGFDYVSVNPSSIYYLPMKQVKYLYRATSVMPSNNETDSFKQYKACVLYILTGQNYESLLSDYHSLDKLVEKNPYLEQILETTNRNQLLNILDKIENLATYQEWEQVRRTKNKFKNVGIAFITTIVLTNVLTGLSVIAVKNHQKEVAIEQVKDSYKTTKIKADITTALNNKNYDRAIELMKSDKQSDKQIAQQMYDVGEYQTALYYNDKLLENIVSAYWKSGKQDKISSLRLADSSSKAVKNQLELEQAIASYNTEKMQQELGFTENPNTLMRMALKYIDENELLNADTVADKLKGVNNSKAQYKYVKVVYDLKDAQLKLKDSQNQLLSANDSSDSNNKEKQINQAQNDIAKYASTIEKLKNKEKEAKKEVYK